MDPVGWPPSIGGLLKPISPNGIYVPKHTTSVLMGKS